MAAETKTGSLRKPGLLESGLKQRSDLLNSILSAAAVGIGLVKERVIKEANPFLCNMLGYQAEELFGRSARILYHSDQEYERVGDVKYRQIEESGQGTIETRWVKKNGELLDIRLSSVPLEPSDLSKGLIFTALDITERKQAIRDLSKSISRSLNIIQTSPLGIFIYELDKEEQLILINANPATESILGQDYTLMLGKTILEVFPNLADTEIPENYTRVALTGRNWSSTNFIYKDDTIDGAYDILAFQIAPRQVAVMFSDITERKQTEQKLQQSEEKHRKIFQNIQDVYFEMDPDTIILEVSPSVAKISKYSREELLGQSIDKLVVDEKIKNVFLELLYSRGELLDFDVPLKDRDGRIVFCSVNVKIEENEEGQPAKIIGLLRDITERRLAREKISKLERAVEQSPLSIIIIDLEGKIEYVNPKYCEVTGYTPEEVIGQRPHLSNSAEELHESHGEVWKTVTSGKEWRGELHSKRKDGSQFWELASISPIRNEMNEITHYISIKEDITERKRREEELKAAKEKAEESDRLKSSFLANMSHEIRTPMNAILGFTELLKNKDVPESDRREYLNLIGTKGKDLMTIISDLIDISRIESGDMKLARTNIHVNELVSEVFEQMKKEKDFREKDMVQIRISLPEGSDSIIMSDKSRLRQVFTNLLSNALKFTNEGYVEIGYTTHEGSVQFFVRDTGIGIEPEKHDIIFERFRQAEDSYTRKYGGTGLGLAISKQIVGLLGGEIWLESSPGQGSTFWFSIPLKSTETLQNNLPDMADVIAARDLNLENRKILIAEDDPSNYLFLESFLSQFKAELIWARDGNQVVEMHRQNRDLDLILMDIRMPVLNGLEATAKIRKSDPEIPIIALTAFAFAEDRVKSVQAGCNEHLSKPVKVDELKILLSRYIKARKPD